MLAPVFAEDFLTTCKAVKTDKRSTTSIGKPSSRYVLNLAAVWAVKLSLTSLHLSTPCADSAEFDTSETSTEVVLMIF